MGLKDETTTLGLAHRPMLGRFRRRGPPDPRMQIRHLSFVAPCREDRQPGRRPRSRREIHARTNRCAIRLPPSNLTGSVEPWGLAVNASGETLVVQDTSGWFVVHPGKDPARIRLEPKPDPRKSAVSNDNRYAAIAGWERGGATVWDARSGAKLADLEVGRHGVLQFSPDGQFLAATPEGVTLWRTSDWRRTSQLHAQGTTPAGLGIAFSPDSRVLAVGQVNGVVALVDPHTGAEWARLSDRDLDVASIMSFSPDQRWLITSSVDHRSPAQVWDLTAMRRELRDRGLDWPAEVLRAATSEQSFEEQIEIVLDEVGLFDDSPQSNVQDSSQPSQNSR